MAAGRITYDDGSPAPGTVVACGSAVTVTDDEGRFQIDEEGSYLVVTRPDGWTAEPWFVPARRDVPDFVLRPSWTSGDRFIHLTDLHLSARPPARHMEVPNRPEEVLDAVDGVLGSSPMTDLIVATGDLTDSGLDEEYEMLASVLEAVSVEAVAVPGNHDHMAGEPRFLVSDRGYGTNEGDPKAWERHLGPRWFSFDRCGLHFVVIDWHMWELGVDRDIQERWIANDLAAHHDTPWVLLSHDQMPAEFFEGLPTPVATFSGHWHATRTVRTGTTLHVSTPPLTFAGLDHASAGVVEAVWDGQEMTIRRHAIPAPTPAPPGIQPRWSLKLGNTAGLAAPVVIGSNLVCVVTWDDASGHGFVDAVDIMTGERSWQHTTRRAIKARLAVAGDQVFLVDVAGGVVALDVADGRVRWEVPPMTPLRTWCWAAPVVVGSVVIVSTPTRVAAHRSTDGTLVWERTGLVPHANLLAHSNPLVVGETIVVGYWPFSPNFFCLGASQGDVLWTVDDLDGGSLENASGRGFALGSWSPVGPGVDAGDRVVFPTAGGWVAVDTEAGDMLWRSHDDGRFRPGKPTLVDDGVVVSSPDEVKRLSLDDGAVEWSTSFPAGGMALAPYRSTPHVGTAGSVVVADTAVVPGLDGSLYRLGIAGGADQGTVAVGVPSAAEPLLADDLLVVLGVEGSLIALSSEDVAA